MPKLMSLETLLPIEMVEKRCDMRLLVSLNWTDAAVPVEERAALTFVELESIESCSRRRPRRSRRRYGMPQMLSVSLP